MRHVVLLLALAGCDKLFDLPEVAHTPGDGGDRDERDAAALDARDRVPDAGVCPPQVAHDEDGDGLDDSCDACPTVVSNPPDDTDGDGLPDACDPNLAPGGDRILLATMFAATEDLGDYTTVLVTPSTANNGIVTIAGQGLLENQVPLLPTIIEIRTGALDLPSATTQMTIAVDAAPQTFECFIAGASCNSDSADDTCLYTQPGNSATDWPVDSATISTIRVRGAGDARCIATNGGAEAIGSSAVTLVGGTFRIGATAGATIPVKSIVVYGGP